MVLRHCLTAVAFLGMGDDHAHMAVLLSDLSFEGAEVMAVRLGNMAPERLETVFGIRDLQAPGMRHVVIVDHGKIIQFQVCGDHDRLPDAPLVGFAVSDHRVDAAFVLFFDLQGQGCAHGDTDAVAEGTCRGFNAGDLEAVRMAAERRFELAKGIDLRNVKITEPGQDAIQGQARMPFAQDKDVTLVPGGVLRVMTDDLIKRA